MKKLALSAILLSSLVAHSQTKISKPTEGAVTAEVGLTGGLNNANFNLNNNAGLLRFRYFAKDDLAVRVGFSARSNNETNNFYGGAGGTQLGTQEVKFNGFAVNLGVEKHFAGSDRLSTYVGADLIFQTTTAKEEWNNFNGSSYTAGFSRDVKGFNTNGDVSALSYGLRAVAGADYYIAKKLYLGAEFGLGFLSSKNRDTEDRITSTSGGVTTTTVNNQQSSGKSNSIAPAVITGVRIGFQF